MRLGSTMHDDPDDTFIFSDAVSGDDTDATLFADASEEQEEASE